VPKQLDVELAVAAITGTLSQVSRQLFFGGFAQRSGPSLGSQLTHLLTAALTTPTGAPP
jgi:hypothetical protein